MAGNYRENQPLCGASPSGRQTETKNLLPAPCTHLHVAMWLMHADAWTPFLCSVARCVVGPAVMRSLARQERLTQRLPQRAIPVK